ncbi:uncharacterized protein LAESUDRAFT_647164 [Laetiporus sulphureus 93-53]|uniref:Uncharacterized protein n=1 Tax=Laetiporus sulphureus 93-53 TaxID=1314785 RepID=A0A165FQE7_9APHY|nr:uncharacterized protein LAESUDRAFT_647164 [Laetiporus sulphureus 93-53]KZT09322.1 hypothetical protein LAESUDRAFT_647164 [Laetiporus sulphureus 93-53]
MSQSVIYSSPPIAGRPPYATDIPDSEYEQRPAQIRRIRQPAPENPNDRTSAYNMCVFDFGFVMLHSIARCQQRWSKDLCASASCHLTQKYRYDQYLESAKQPPRYDNPFDDSKYMHDVKQPQRAIPIAAPRPGYPAPVAALNLAQPRRAATPEGRQRSPSPSALSPEMSQAFPKPLTLVSRQASPVSGPLHNAPHELQPSMTPISPAFIRPSSAASQRRDVKFSPTPILRGDQEETLLLKQGKGEEFWRRFSMVAHDDLARKEKPSTLDGNSRYSRWVWIVGMMLLTIIVLLVCLIVYKVKSDNSTSNVVTALGGSANEEYSSSADGAASTSLFVSPTYTVARRSDVFEDVVPTSIPEPIAHLAPSPRGSHSRTQHRRGSHSRAQYRRGSHSRTQYRRDSHSRIQSRRSIENGTSLD